MFSFGNLTIVHIFVGETSPLGKFIQFTSLIVCMLPLCHPQMLNFSGVKYWEQPYLGFGLGLGWLVFLWLAYIKLYKRCHWVWV